MDLGKAIVVKNEYGIKGASKYGTPRSYILGYESRDNAVERVIPIRLSDTQDYFVQRYADRADAVNNARDKYLDRDGADRLKSDMYKLQGAGGIAFSNGDVAMPADKLIKCADEFQKGFDKGKTFLKTVISFSYSYLLEHGILPQDFPLRKDGDDYRILSEGDLRGNVDQMKIRFAIMNGLEKIADDYDDLRYVGSMHVNAHNLHCHLAMMDMGDGNITPDGTQKGKLTARQMDAMRRGIDMYLEEYQAMPALNSEVDHEKRNVACHVKQYATQMIADRGEIQFILACLPENRNMWVSASQRPDMKRANKLVEKYAEEFLERDDSGYEEAMDRIHDYAERRMLDEGFGQDGYDRIIEAGRQRIVHEAMDSIYSVLKTIPEDEVSVSTPFMSGMAADKQDLVASLQVDGKGDPFMEFGYKFRSYRSRLEHHRQEKHKYHDAVRTYESRMQSGNYDEKSLPLLDFFRVEEEYNTMLASKYQFLLPFDISVSDYTDDVEAFNEFKERVENMRKLVDDGAFAAMRADNAEMYGISQYGEAGASLMVTDPQAMRAKFEEMESDLELKRSELASHLSDYGLEFDEEKGNVRRISQWDFNGVKGLDLHVLGYDFSGNVDIPDQVIRNFTDMANRRYGAFQAARDYLERTGQQAALASFPVDDINRQHALAQRLHEGSVLETQRRPDTKAVNDVKTVPVDYGAYAEQELEMRRLVHDNVRALQYEYA